MWGVPERWLCAGCVWEAMPTHWLCYSSRVSSLLCLSSLAPLHIYVMRKPRHWMCNSNTPSHWTRTSDMSFVLGLPCGDTFSLCLNWSALLTNNKVCGPRGERVYCIRKSVNVMQDHKLRYLWNCHLLPCVQNIQQLSRAGYAKSHNTRY